MPHMRNTFCKIQKKGPQTQTSDVASQTLLLGGFRIKKSVRITNIYWYTDDVEKTS